MSSFKLRWPSYVLTIFLFFGLALSLSSRALADDEQDPPDRVARLSLTNGEVSFSPAGTDDWVSAVLNRPITTGDKLWTDRDARAELHVGAAAFRLGQTTGFSFLNLSDNMIQVRLTEGTISFRVRRLDQGDSIEIDTPNLAFNVLRPGRYRINVNENGDTTIINVREGQGEITGGGSAYTLHGGDQGIFTGTDTLNADMETLAEDDDFDVWCNERDLHEEHAVAHRYVSDDVIGYEDLDDYGGWRAVPDYGTVWFPHVTVVTWAPYRFGHWIWVAPWGWTWVDNAPWGFAPFHYGRWVFYGGAWGWVPTPPRPIGVAYVRPVYAPALVAWVGGPHFAAGVAFGAGIGVGVNVGWFPLGPREVFVPSYPVSRTYVNNVNISNTTVNTTVINNYYNNTTINKNVTVNNVHYMNQSVPNAVTATSGQNFASARPVNANLVKVDSKQVAAAPAYAAAPAIAPPKQAFVGAGAPTNVHPPAALQSRQVVARTAPPPPPPSYEKQQSAIQANEGRPISTTQYRQLQPAAVRTAAASVRIAPAATPKSVPYTGNSSANANGNRANTSAPNNKPANNAANAPANANRNDRPPSARSVNVDPQLEQKHQQQVQQLQQKQDQERQKLDQKNYQEQQKLQQQTANEEKQRQAEEKQQQKINEMEQKHDAQQKQLEQKQTAEHQKSQPPPKQSSESKPHK